MYPSVCFVACWYSRESRGGLVVWWFGGGEGGELRDEA